MLDHLVHGASAAPTTIIASGVLVMSGHAWLQRGGKRANLRLRESTACSGFTIGYQKRCSTTP